jgi:hypothetical protein
LLGAEADEWIGAVSDKGTEFWGVGLDMSKGLARGITAGKSSVISAAIAVATAAIAAARATLGIQSPSKVFAEMGTMMMVGMAQGIENGSGMAVDSVVSAMHGVTSAAEGETQNAAMLTRLENIEYRLDNLPLAFKEAVQMIV